MSDITLDLIKTYNFKIEYDKCGVSDDFKKGYYLESNGFYVYDLENDKKFFNGYTQDRIYGHGIYHNSWSNCIVFGLSDGAKEINLDFGDEKLVWVSRNLNFAFNKNGAYMYNSGDDNIIEMRDVVDDYRLIQEIGSHVRGEKIETILLSDNERYLVSDAVYEARIWDLADGKSMELETKSGLLTAMTISKDDKYVIGSPYGGKIIWFWDLETGKFIKRISTNHSDRINDMTTTLDGKYLITADNSWFLKLIDIEKGEVIKTIETTGEIKCLKVSKDGKTLFVGNDRGSELRRLYSTPTKYLFKDKKTIYVPTLVGKISLGDIEVNEDTIIENGVTNFKLIYGKNQKLTLESDLATLNKSQVYLNETPQGWHNTKEDFEIVFENGFENGGE